MIALLICLSCVVIYLWNKWKFQQWDRLEIPNIQPNQLFGNFKDAVFVKKAVGDIYVDIYNKFKGYPYVGVYIMRRAGLLVRDPNIIKDILVKDFSSFHDNDFIIDEKVDPIFGSNPFSLKGNKWKLERARHTPHFTSGRVKPMFPLLDQAGDKMIVFLNNEIKLNGGSFCMETFELASKFTTDAVANCALGINGRCFDEPKAELREMGRKIMDPNLLNGIKQFLVFIMPSLASFLTIRLIPDDVTTFFKRIVTETLSYRKENSIVRNDFFDAIREYKGVENSIDQLTKQVGSFFLDGVITSSVTLSFVFYELAVNQDVQEKLRQEIDDTLSKHGGRLDYETLQDMAYLDGVVSESLRKNTPLSHMTKECTKEFTLPPVAKGKSSLLVQTGTPVVIPVRGLHYDEKYFPDPDKFDPERFIGKNKEDIVKYTYLPFSEGPRACLGMRYGIVQLKVAVAKIVSSFELRLNAKTKTPIQLDPKAILLAAVGGLWIDFCKRRN